VLLLSANDAGGDGTGSGSLLVGGGGGAGEFGLGDGGITSSKGGEESTSSGISSSLSGEYGKGGSGLKSSNQGSSSEGGAVASGLAACGLAACGLASGLAASVSSASAASNKNTRMTPPGGRPLRPGGLPAYLIACGVRRVLEYKIKICVAFDGSSNRETRMWLVVSRENGGLHTCRPPANRSQMGEMGDLVKPVFGACSRVVIYS
jgi:hypothetical protein